MKVSIRPCATYDLLEIQRSVEEGLSFVFGDHLPIRKGQRVLLKVNMLSDKEPEKAVTTHPALVEAMIAVVRKAGAEPVVGDSPFPFVPWERASRKTGMAGLCRQRKVELLALEDPVRIAFNDGFAVKAFQLTKHLETFDAIIDLPKLKTHSFMGYTGAIKNLFGLVSGKGKPALHLRFQQERHFSLMLLDLYRLTRSKTVMTVMDAVTCMEGPGPLNGTPRHLGYVLVGSDALAVDTVASRMAGLRAPYLAEAKKKGLLGSRLEDIRTDTDIGGLGIQHFIPAKKANYALPFVNSVRNLFVPYPVLREDRCVHCKRCYHACPAQAITFPEDHPVFDYRKCIRCYCCQEMCPEHAIVLKRPFLAGISEKKR